MIRQTALLGLPVEPNSLPNEGVSYGFQIMSSFKYHAINHLINGFESVLGVVSIIRHLARPDLFIPQG